MMRRQLAHRPAMIVVLTVLLGLVYPLVVTGVAQVAFDDKAERLARQGRTARSSARR